MKKLTTSELNALGKAAPMITSMVEELLELRAHAEWLEARNDKYQDCVLGILATFGHDLPEDTDGNELLEYATKWVKDECPDGPTS